MMIYHIAYQAHFTKIPQNPKYILIESSRLSYLLDAVTCKKNHLIFPGEPRLADMVDSSELVFILVIQVY